MDDKDGDGDKRTRISREKTQEGKNAARRADVEA